MGLGNDIFWRAYDPQNIQQQSVLPLSLFNLDMFGYFWLWDIGWVLSPAIIGLTEGAVFLQEIMPGPVIQVNTVAADYCQTDLSQTGTENNSNRLF